MNVKISVENFRVFKEITEFELAPITILTGPNNSGKSSFLKLIDLLKVSFGTNNNFDKLCFDQGNHNLGTFDKVINRDNPSDEIKLIFNFPLEDFDEEFDLELNYKSLHENGELKSFKIFNDNRTLLLLDEFTLEKFEKGYYMASCFVELDIKYLKRVFNQNTICKEEKNYSQNIRKSFKRHCDEAPFENPGEIINYHSPLEYDKLVQDLELLKIDKYAKKFFNQEYQELRNSNDLIPMFYFDDKYIKMTKDECEKKFQVKLDDGTLLKTEEILFSGDCHHTMGNRDGKTVDYNKINKMFVNEHFELGEFEDVFHLVYNDINNMVNTFDIFSLKDKQADYFNEYFVKNIGKALQKLNLSFKAIDFVSASRGNKNRILSNKSSNDIDEIVKEFYEINLEEDYKVFLKKSLNILEIRGTIEIERIEGVASVIYLKQNDEQVSLSDLGYGYSQIIPILLKILLVDRDFTQLSVNNPHSLMSEIYTKIIIEEPEANLHPNLQSKLAEVFVLANKMFGTHFILETHSVYLIRKLQYLTAKGEINKGEAIIYYYNDDKYVTTEEPKVKKIEINENGGLTDTFGPGFFDEDIKLQFELLKLNKRQSN